MDYEAIKSGLLRLQEEPEVSKESGVAVHKLQHRRPMSENMISRFELAEGVRLPGDYRGFLRNVGNGAGGPGYGIFPLLEVQHVHASEPWVRLRTQFIGAVGKPFPFTEPWNDLTGCC